MKKFSQILDLVEAVKQRRGDDSIKDLATEEGLKDACWKGYEAIGTKKKNGREVPNCVPVKEEALDEGKMAQLHADIEDHLGKHVANYKKMGGSEHLGNKTVEVAKKIAKLHNISHEAAQKHVNDYVDNNLKEETEQEKAAAELKLKLTKWKNQQRAAKAMSEEKKEDLPFTPDKPKKNPVAKAGKYGLGYSIAKHLARQGMKKMTKEDVNLTEAHVVHVSDGSKYDEEPHKDDVKHVNDGVKKHGGTFDGHSDKGAFFKFKSHSDAENFRRHVNACPKRSCNANHLDESVNEAVDKDHPIYKEYQALRKMPIKDLRDRIKQQHRIVDTSEFRTKEHAASHIINTKHGNKRVKAVFGEETEQIDEAYRLPSDSEISKVKAHVKANHPNKSLAQVAVHKASKKIEYVVKDKDGKMTGHTLGEEVEQIDEISKQTLGNYIKRSSHDAALSARHGGSDPKELKNAIKRLKGIAKATNKLTKEETEQIEEASKINWPKEVPSDRDALRAHNRDDEDRDPHPYVNPYDQGARKHSEPKKNVKEEKRGLWANIHAKRERIKRGSGERMRKPGSKGAPTDAALKAAAEGVEINELSKDTLNSYVHKAFAQGNDLHYDLAHSRGNKATDAERAAMKAKLSKRNSGIIKAAKKLREELDLDEDVTTAEYKIKTYFDNAAGKTVHRKIRPHRVNFKNSKMHGEPVQDDDRGDVGMKEDSVKKKLGDKNSVVQKPKQDKPFNGDN